MAPDPFDLFWADYPRKVGKLAARRQWDARRKQGHTPEEMLGGLARYARCLKAERTELRYVKHPATFLGRDLWFLEDWKPAAGAAAPPAGDHKARLLGARS